MSIACSSKGGWVLGAKAFHGNCYDGHTLGETIEQLKSHAIEPDHCFVDMGYRGHGYVGEVEVHVDKKRRGKTPRALWKWLKGRARIEASISHLKSRHMRLRSVCSKEKKVTK